MCELIISVVDRTSSDPYVDAKCIKRGVVIETRPDGAAYGDEELTNPIFRILRLPGVAPSFGEAFQGAELPASQDTAPVSTRNTLLNWQYKLDIDSSLIPADMAAYLADNTRAAPAYSIDPSTLPQATMAGLKVKLPSISTDIGTSSSTIG